MVRGIRYRLNSAVPAFMPKALHRLSDRDSVAITIDDAPSGSTLDEVLAFCERRGLRLTWFLRGDMTEQYPGMAKQLAAAGHEMGSHGYRHIAPALLDAARLNDDIVLSLQAIEQACGEQPRLYRPPYGRLRPAQTEIPGSLGLTTVLWNHMPDDWDPSISMKTLERRLRAVQGGDIVVLHEHPGRTEILHRALEVLSDVLEQKHLTTVCITARERSS